MPARLPSREPVARPRFGTRQRARPELPAPIVTRAGVTYRDGDGIWWTVREEVSADDASPAGAGASLLFESPGRRLRVARCPRFWRELSAAGLVALSTAG